MFLCSYRYKFFFQGFEDLIEDFAFLKEANIYRTVPPIIAWESCLLDFRKLLLLLIQCDIRT